MQSVRPRTVPGLLSLTPEDLASKKGMLEFHVYKHKVRRTNETTSVLSHHSNFTPKIQSHALKERSTNCLILQCSLPHRETLFSRHHIMTSHNLRHKVGDLIPPFLLTYKSTVTLSDHRRTDFPLTIS